jgi:hypothetical protein
MEERHVWTVMVVAVIAGITTGIMVWWLASGLGQLYCALIGSTIIFGTVFLSKFRIGKATGLGRSTLPKAANELRARGYWVEEKQGRVNIRLSRWFAVDLLEQESGPSHFIIFRASATNDGWIVMMISFFIWVLAPMGAILALYSMHKTKRFADTILNTEPSTSETAIDPTRAKLIETLSEARQLADEAMRSVRSNHQDLVAIMAVVGLVVGMAVYIGLFLLFVPSVSPLLTLGIGVIVAIFLPLGTSIIVGRKVREEVQQKRMWADKLDKALTREMIGKGPGDGEESSMELLFRAYDLLPDWMSARRKAGMYRSPGTWTLIFFSVILTGSLMLSGIVALFSDAIAGIVPLLISMAFLAISYHLYHSWKRNEGEEEASTRLRFTSRFDSLEQTIESGLRER